MELKIEAVNKIAKTRLFKNRWNICNYTLCPKSNKYHAKKCIWRSCHECGVGKLDGLDIFQNPEKCGTIEWEEWNQSPEGKKAKITQHGDIEKFKQELKGSVEKLSKHLFVAQWQQDQYNIIRNNPEPNMLVIADDFQQNYRTQYQREVSSAHIGHMGK